MSQKQHYIDADRFNQMVDMAMNAKLERIEEIQPLLEEMKKYDINETAMKQISSMLKNVSSSTKTWVPAPLAIKEKKTEKIDTR